EGSGIMPALTLYGRRNAVLTEEQVLAHFVTTETTAIEGAGMLRFGGDATNGTLRIDLLTDVSPLIGRRVELRIWQRAFGTRASPALAWLAGSADSASAATIAMLAFQPTERATDDGWEEWTSGPIDFALANRLVPMISLSDAQVSGFGGGRDVNA